MLGPILIAEDDADLARGILTVLQAEGHGAEVVSSGDLVMTAVQRLRPRLLVLDVMLPRRDGFAIVSNLRAIGEDLPVLMLTARGQERDRLRGFESGADDYLVKPFSIRELQARIRSLLRRSGDATPTRIELGTGVVADLLRQELVAGGRSETLTGHETGVLRVLAAAAGRPVPRSRLIAEAWGGAAVTERTVDFHIANLRRKLTAIAGPDGRRMLHTLHGQGFSLTPLT
jgi:DNA-binding response OmpR family regulator